MWIDRFLGLKNCKLLSRALDTKHVRFEKLRLPLLRSRCLRSWQTEHFSEYIYLFLDPCSHFFHLLRPFKQVIVFFGCFPCRPDILQIESLKTGRPICTSGLLRIRRSRDFQAFNFLKCSVGFLYPRELVSVHAHPKSLIFHTFSAWNSPGQESSVVQKH